MMLTRTLTVLIITLALAPAALAQPREASEREKAYGKRLAEVLSRYEGEAGAVTPTSVGAPVGRGIRVELGRGLEVTRLRFRTPEDAQQHVANLYHTGLPAAPIVAEVRGNQVIVARGVALNEPDDAHRLRLAVWEGLPAPSDVTDARLTRLDVGVALSTRLKTGPLRDYIDLWSRVIRRRARENVVGNHAPDETRGFLDDPLGMMVRVRSDEDGGSFWSVSDPIDAEHVLAHFDALGGHPVPTTPPEPTPGMRKILDGLWTEAP